ncbi:MAG: hypothetical protein JST68_10495 [Bacteroidetes bacterium]|nr:hypothetical protein [Bacteroidota bacterium]
MPELPGPLQYPKSNDGLPHSLTFRRTESDGIYFSDLQTSIKFSQKFDVFDDTKLIGTLVTNNRKAFVLTLDDSRLTLKTKSNWFNKWYYNLLNESGEPVAIIFVKNPFLRPYIYSLTFPKNNRTYFLHRRGYLETKRLKANMIYDLQMNGTTCCTVINYRKLPIISSIASARLEGAIHFNDDFGIQEILCFLQLVQIELAND